MLHLLLCKDWTVGSAICLNRIARDVAEGKGGRILMVPELISHETERKLCMAAGDTASRYAEVLSFSRLARRVAEGAGAASLQCLDNGGRLVAMASAARQLHSKLKAYAAVETKPEFLTGLIDAVDEFKRCCITAEDLKQASLGTEGSLAQKLEELALLLETYDALCSRGKRDPRDQMTWVLEQLEDSDFGSEHVFYIDGFPDFTRQHLAIIRHLIQTSPDVTVCLNCDRADSQRMAFEKAGDTAAQLIRCAADAAVAVDIEILSQDPHPLDAVREYLFQGSIPKIHLGNRLQVTSAESAYQECLYTADRILEMVRSGCRFRDITVVCTDMPAYENVLKLVFARCGIPLYRSGTEEILQKSVIATVLAAMDAALGGFEQRDVLRYLRSALSPLDPDICDLVENYSVIWAVRGKAWLSSWEKHPDGLEGLWTEHTKVQLEKLNRARQLALEPLSRLSQGFAGAANLSEQVAVLYQFLDEIRLAYRLEKLAATLDRAGDNRSAQILNQLWDILLDAMEQLHDVLGETVWDTENFARLFRLLLSQYDVGTIPPVLDAVQAGPVSAMRCHQEKYLFVLGAQEGLLPTYSGSAGVLSDPERVALRRLGVPLTGGAMEGVQAEFAEIYGVFCGAQERIFVSYSGSQPSFVCRRLTQLAGGETVQPPLLGISQGSGEEAAAFLARFSAEDAAHRLQLDAQYIQIQQRRDYDLGRVNPQNIAALYGEMLTLSASQIDTQAECRMAYFLKYGMRARERKEAAVDPAEFGTYVHAVLENTARAVRDMGGFPKVTLEETLELARRYSQEYADERFRYIDSQRMNYLFQRNAAELEMVVSELWEELRKAAFEPVDFELGFGKEDGLPPIAIPGKISAQLRGFIDRVDVWRSGKNDYYRVVDYKTGRKDFDYCDVFNGVGLQMLLYLFTLQQNGQIIGDNPVAAGVQYFPARVPYITADGIQDEAVEKDRDKAWKRKGLLLQDEAVLQAMEPGDHPNRCYSITSKGIVGDLADREQLRLLERYVFHTLEKMVNSIADGYVEPNPYTRGSSHSACAFCPYGSICHKETVPGRRNYQTMSSQKFWEEVGKEMNRNG